MRFSHPPIIAASRQNKLVAPLVFQGSCNTEVVDVYFEEVLLLAWSSGFGISAVSKLNALLSVIFDKALNGRRMNCFAR